MFSEVTFSILLLLGLLTRLNNFDFTVHAGKEYNIADKGYKMFIIYLLMMIPLLVQGSGLFGMDTFFCRKWQFWQKM